MSDVSLQSPAAKSGKAAGIRRRSLLPRPKISTKLFMAGFVFFIPIAVMAWFIVAGIRSSITFAEREMEGVKIERPLVEALASLGRWRSAREGGDDVTVPAAAIDRDFASIRAMTTEIRDLAMDDRGRSLHAQDFISVEDVAGHWNTLKTMTGNYADALSSLTVETLALVAYVGNTSNLILDPDLDTYYTMDAAFVLLPAASARFMAMDKALDSAVEAGTVGKKAAADFAVLSAFLGQIDRNQVAAALRTALAEDKNFFGIDASLQARIPPLLDSYQKNTSPLADLLSAYGDGTRRLNADEFDAAWATALDSTMALFEPLTQEMTSLLQLRVAAFMAQVRLALAASLASVLLAFLVIILVDRSIVASVIVIQKAAGRIAESLDLTVRVPIGLLGERTEIGGLGSSLNVLIEKLMGIVTTLTATQGKLTVAGRELGESSTATEGAVERISGKIEEVRGGTRFQSERVSEASSAVEQIAQGIESLEKLIMGQSTSVTEASASIEQMVGNIESVTSSIERMSREFETLSGAANEGKKVQSTARTHASQIADRSRILLEANAAISAIASRTNLLAMNAAIEAAHAGDSGRGFSVVADEIRKLAETASAQSRTIRTELTEVQNAIADLETASKNADDSFSNVATGITTTDALVREVRTAMAEQREGSTQILEALRQMNDMTSEVRSGSQEMSSGNATILGEMERLRTSAGEIARSMDEMKSSAVDIEQSAQNVAATAGRTAEAIVGMKQAIEQFKV